MQQLAVTKQRITSIDFLRGLVMVIMALDHVRDYFHEGAMIDDPTNLATTTPFLFFTRWITHFCAPAFVFLAGTSACLMGQHKTKKELSIFLFTRGLWLIIAEVIIVTLAWTFNPFYNMLIFQVIWAIGISMVVLSLLVWLPLPLLFIIGIIIVFGHNMLDYYEAERKGEVSAIWNILHTPSSAFVYPVSDSRFFIFLYAFPAWTGVMMLGYCFGTFYKEKFRPEQRRKAFKIIGWGAVLLFVLLRLANIYGDRVSWSYQSSTALTIMSFLNVTKYPPSLLYILMTLGPSILLLAFLDNIQNRLPKFFITFGRVPFFYYILHLYLIHTLCVIAFFLSGYGAKDIIAQPFFFRPAEFGFNLLAVYGIWIVVVLLLYPLCKWYERYKYSHHHWALSYL